MHYDIIGDIHGHADKLTALLQRMGYVLRHNVWQPPTNHQALFVGDLIDRGPQQCETVNIVRRMVDAGVAHCIMGNHEFNAIGYATPRLDGSGAYLRPHSEKNNKQHHAFLREVEFGSGLHCELIEWFKTLPPYLDRGVLRVVHAWWHHEYIDHIGSQLLSSGKMSNDFLYAAYDKQSLSYRSMEGVTKGLEIKLPHGLTYQDKEGITRDEVRTQWWHESPKTFQDVTIIEEAHRHLIPAEPLPSSFLGRPNHGSPIFVGHYWMLGTPSIQTATVACVDYSAGKVGKNHPLIAYRWQGESLLNNKHFIASQ
jgi:hypothetical protein